MQHILGSIAREQRGSAVAQATGVAIVCTVIVAAIFNSLGWWEAGVVNGLRCYVANFDGNSCSGAGWQIPWQAVTDHAVAVLVRGSPQL